MFDQPSPMLSCLPSSQLEALSVLLFLAQPNHMEVLPFKFPALQVGASESHYYFQTKSCWDWAASYTDGMPKIHIQILSALHHPVHTSNQSSWSLCQWLRWRYFWINASLLSLSFVVNLQRCLMWFKLCWQSDLDFLPICDMPVKPTGIITIQIIFRNYFITIWYIT